MSAFEITLPGGASRRLKTGGKYCPADILVTALGSAPVEESDVNFYDYDGSLLHTYTLEALRALTELPPLPSHEGLTCQGWNWSLEDLKAYGKPYDVLPYYITEDGATWYDLVNDTGRAITVTFRWKQYTNQPAPVLDFGDGSETVTLETVANGAVVSCSHTYAPGTYRAKLSGFYHLGDGNAISDIEENRCILLKRVFFGEYPTAIYPYAFRYNVRLETVTMTNNCKIGGGQAFGYCYNLKALPAACNSNLPSSFVADCKSMIVVSMANGTLGHYGVGSCSNLKRLCLPDTTTGFHSNNADNVALVYTNIPNGTTSVPNNAFIRNYSLIKLDVPDTVTSIGSNAFNNCISMHTLRLNSIVPPAVANANAFSGIPGSCIVEVPAESLTTYQEATNYGAIAAQMVGV